MGNLDPRRLRELAGIARQRLAWRAGVTDTIARRFDADPAAVPAHAHARLTAAYSALLSELRGRAAQLPAQWPPPDDVAVVPARVRKIAAFTRSEAAALARVNAATARLYDCARLAASARERQRLDRVYGTLIRQARERFAALELDQGQAQPALRLVRGGAVL